MICGHTRLLKGNRDVNVINAAHHFAGATAPAGQYLYRGIVENLVARALNDSDLRHLVGFRLNL
jgi:hypothetical protein